jgi:hypothetical protein
MAMYRDQNAGRSHNIKFDNSSFEGVEGFKYLEKPSINQNSVHEEIRNGLKSGNACYNSVQSFCLLLCYTKI